MNGEWWIRKWQKKKIFSRYYWYDQLLSHLYFFRGYSVGNFPYIVKTGKETETLEYHDGSTTYHWSIHFQSIWLVVALVRTEHGFVLYIFCFIVHISLFGFGGTFFKEWSKWSLVSSIILKSSSIHDAGL